ncbi:MAG TPA: DUF3011 domain-containing protein [Longimicrobiaceae bacterium]|nr:DUF3011 domain-containing protein [Longimicrobiaceae bacterium]
MKSILRLALPAFGALALTAFGAGQAAAQQNVRCESQNRDRNYCRADVRGGARLVRQLSSSACERGRTWGTVAGRGIWVSNGCRGDFVVGDNGNGNRDRMGNGNGRWNRGNARADRNGASANNAFAARACQTAILRGVRNGSSAQLSDARSNGRNGDYVLDWRTAREAGTCRVTSDGQVMLTRNR